MSRPNSQEGMWVISSDAHWPVTSRETLSAMLDFIRRNRNKIVGYIDLGDTFDNASIAHHNKGKALFQVPGSFKAETDSYRTEFLEPLEAALPRRAKKVAIVGNHTRFEQDFIEEHPELAGVIDRFGDLRLKDRGWEIVPLGMSYQLGKLTCIHGDQLGGPYGGGIMPSRRAVEVYGTNVIQGHTHSPQSFCRVSPVSITEKRIGYICPILGTLNPKYMRNRPNSWANGWCVAEVRRDGTFNLYTMICTRGLVTFAGETYPKPQRKAA